jgi:hypothetical protein
MRALMLQGRKLFLNDACSERCWGVVDGGLFTQTPTRWFSRKSP